MNLLNRYLQAVGKYLPKARRDDIVAELRANLLSQIEDREETLGRPLSEEEIVEMLKHHGNPAVVAGRYFPENRGLAFGRQLIGPELFPFYRIVLLMNLTITLAILAAVALIPAGGRSALGPITAGRVLTPLLAQFAAVTLVFIILDLGKAHVLNQWDPGKLPAVRANPEDGPNAASIIAFLALAVGTVWLALAKPWPYLLLGPGAFAVQSVPMTLMSDWQVFYWAIVILLAAQLVVQFFSLFRLLARRKVKIAELASKIVGLGIGVPLLFRAPNYVTSPDAPVAEWANEIFLISLIVWLVIHLFAIGKLVFSLLRERHQMLPARQH